MIQTLRAHLDGARIRWQGFMESSIGGFPVRVHPADRSFWVDTNFACWEPETIAVYREFVRPGSSYCDIGAWIGPTGILASKLGATVTCFEPDPLAFERLLFNLRMNNCPANSHRLALAGADGTRRMGAMAAHLGQSGTSLMAPERGQESVDVIALSWQTAWKLLGSPRFDFVKIDIEGGECELLPAMLDYLKEFRPIVYLSTHWRFIPEDQRAGFLETIERLRAIYPSADSLNAGAVQTGFPAFLLRP